MFWLQYLIRGHNWSSIHSGFVICWFACSLSFHLSRLVHCSITVGITSPKTPTYPPFSRRGRQPPRPWAAEWSSAGPTWKRSIACTNVRKPEAELPPLLHVPRRDTLFPPPQSLHTPIALIFHQSTTITVAKVIGRSTDTPPTIPGPTSKRPSKISSALMRSEANDLKSAFGFSFGAGLFLVFTAAKITRVEKRVLCSPNGSSKVKMIRPTYDGGKSSDIQRLTFSFVRHHSIRHFFVINTYIPTYTYILATILCYLPITSGFCVLLDKSINQSINRSNLRACVVRLCLNLITSTHVHRQ